MLIVTCFAANHGPEAHDGPILVHRRHAVGDNGNFPCPRNPGNVDIVIRPLPDNLAGQLLSEKEWQIIDGAIGSIDDPLFDEMTADDYQRLYRLIAR